MQQEVFGAASVLVRCPDVATMRNLVEAIEGQLTATLHLNDPADLDAARTLLPTLERKVGRILVNGWPTGVEVGYAMVHGGSYPSTSDSRTTSVGSILSAGIVASIPAICGFAGGVLGGVWSDFLIRRGRSLTSARKIPIVAGMLVSTMMVLCNYVDAQWLVIFIMALSFFGKGIGAQGWAVMSDVAPREIAGLSCGLFNMFGNLSSITTPIIVGAIIQGTGSFNGALVFIVANAFVAILSYLFVVGDIKRLVLTKAAAA